MPRDWNAWAYDSLPLPHEQWGRRTLSRLALAPDATVLDAGCGTGRDTALLLDAIPGGRVVAVDASATMLARLRERVTGLDALDGAGRLDRLDVVRADLTEPIDLPARQVDAVFSVAAFHWISDHEKLFANLAAVVRPGGQLVFECGGTNNIANVERALRNVLGEIPDVWNFAGTEQTHQRLVQAGFTDVDVALVADPAWFEGNVSSGDASTCNSGDGNGDGNSHELLLRYLETVVLGAHLDRLAVDERAAFVRAVADNLSAPVIDYVRLTVSARRAPT
nr:class I SAM-dependent methyltransferase [Micromonospora sp. DSM 115978]